MSFKEEFDALIKNAFREMPTKTIVNPDGFKNLQTIYEKAVVLFGSNSVQMKVDSRCVNGFVTLTTNKISISGDDMDIFRDMISACINAEFVARDDDNISFSVGVPNVFDYA